MADRRDTFDQLTVSRRASLRAIAGGLAAVSLPRHTFARKLDAKPGAEFRLNYVLGSCMYGTTKLSELVPEVAKTGARYLDVWPRHHGDQREQMEAMGHDAFAELLKKHGVSLGMLTRYDLGPLRLQDEMKVAQKLGARLIIAGSRGPKRLRGMELKAAIARFVEQLQPHIHAAEKAGVTIGIENHGASLLSSPDSIRWFAEAAKSKCVGVALAPYHLPQDEALLAGLIRELGPGLVHFYAWQHGNGCMKKLPKEQELLQMPGRGALDFHPLLAALREIRYARWTEVFMHPVPRGIPILETTAKVTQEIERARHYLERSVTQD
jgi:sugar phosphate isomerase/epimerase